MCQCVFYLYNLYNAQKLYNSNETINTKYKIDKMLQIYIPAVVVFFISFVLMVLKPKVIPFVRETCCSCINGSFAKIDSADIIFIL